MSKFCISLTTIPPRFSTISKTLDSLVEQSKKADKIYLNIPIKFQRFSSQIFNSSNLYKKYDNLEIVECEDYGPGTKLLGSLNKILDYDYVVLVDDDHFYKKEMLEIFFNKWQENSNNSYSFCVYDILDCKIGQGADGYLINKNHIEGILEFFNKYIKNNNKLFFNDDLWISVFLNKIMKIDIESTFSLLKNNFFIKNKSIYKKHTQINALIETYGDNRKKARELKFKENCEEYLKLKKLTKNFTLV